MLCTNIANIAGNTTNMSAHMSVRAIERINTLAQDDLFLVSLHNSIVRVAFRSRATLHNTVNIDLYNTPGSSSWSVPLLYILRVSVGIL